MAIIKTNLPAQQSLANLKNTQKQLSTSLERLSSGLRVNGAKDDAAGLGIANRMTANLRANSTVSRGISDGIGLMQVAEGGLNGINDLLQRSRELAVQAANGTLSDTDRASLNAEYKQLRAEIDRIATSTTAFGKYPLAPAAPPVAETVYGSTKSIASLFESSGIKLTGLGSGVKPLGFIPAGAKDVTIMVDGLPGAEDDIQIFDINGKHLVGTPAIGADADPVWTLNGIDSTEKLKDTLFTAENGFQSADGFDGSEPLLHYADTAGKTYSSNLADGISLSYNGMTFTYTGDGDRFPSDTNTTSGSTDANHSVERLRIDEVKEPLFLVVAGRGIFDIAVEWSEMPAGNVAPAPSSNAKVSTSTQIVLGASFGSAPDTVTIGATPADSTSLGLAEVELDPFEKAREAMRKLQEAMNQVDGYRGQYGALTNRFEGAIDNLAQQSISTAAARSRIVDADYATEVANMTRAQILQQGGTSVLSQANQIPQGVLALLR